VCVCVYACVCLSLGVRASVYVSSVVAIFDAFVGIHHTAIKCGEMCVFKCFILLH